jgi:hypothetical protein
MLKLMVHFQLRILRKKGVSLTIHKAKTWMGSSSKESTVLRIPRKKEEGVSLTVYKARIRMVQKKNKVSSAQKEEREDGNSL